MTSSKQINDFIHKYSVIASTKGIVTSKMGYPKWQWGYSSVNFKIKANIEYKLKLSEKDRKL
jgi:hypothetical protein